MNRTTHILLIILLLVLYATGCSGGGNPVTPETTDAELSVTNSDLPPSPTWLCGYFDVIRDPENESFEIMPNRSADFIINIVKFLNNDPFGLSFSFYGTSAGPGYIDIDLGIGIDHPLDDPGFDAYDVRGVYIGNGSGTLGFNSAIKYPLHGTDQILLNADGYTRWFNPSEFGMPGIFGYTQGNAASPGYVGTATLNPYKYYAGGLGQHDDLWDYLNTYDYTPGVFAANIGHMRNYVIRFPIPNPGIKFSYAILASWAGTAPQFHPAYATEAQSARISAGGGLYYIDPGTNGGILSLDIGIFDWGSTLTGGVMEDYYITIQSTVLSSHYTLSSTEMIPVSGGDHYYVYHVEIPADNVTSIEGNELWVIVEYPGSDYSNPAGIPNDASSAILTAYFRTDLSVNTCSIPYGGSENGWAVTDDTYYFDVVTHSNGNVYVIGTSISTAVLKCLSPCGEEVWSHSFLSSDNTSTGEAIAVDGSGNIYISGLFTGPDFDFDPGPGFDLHSGVGMEDVYLCSFDPMGSFRWAVTWGGGSRDKGHDVELDAAGNIYVAGVFYGPTIDLDPGPGEDLKDGRYNSAFVSKFDSSGNYLWGNTWSGTSIWSDDSANGVGVDDFGNVYVTGYYRDFVDFDPDPIDEDFIAALDYSDACLVKYDSTGDYLWTLVWNGISWDIGNSIDVLGNGSVYVTGDLHQNIFLALVDAAGTEAWLVSWGGIEINPDDKGADVVTDSLGNVYVTGAFHGSNVDFDPDPILEDPRTSDGGGDIFLSKFNAAGTYLWARTWGGPYDSGGLAYSDIGQAISISDSGMVYVSGYFHDTVEFAPVDPPCSDASDIHVADGSGPTGFLSKYFPDGCW